MTALTADRMLTVGAVAGEGHASDAPDYARDCGTTAIAVAIIAATRLLPTGTPAIGSCLGGDRTGCYQAAVVATVSTGHRWAHYLLRAADGATDSYCLRRTAEADSRHTFTDRIHHLLHYFHLVAKAIA